MCSLDPLVEFVLRFRECQRENETQDRESIPSLLVKRSLRKAAGPIQAESAQVLGKPEQRTPTRMGQAA